MKRILYVTIALGAFAALSLPAAAQTPAPTPPSTEATSPETPTPPPPAATPAASSWKNGRTIAVQYYRPLDKRGLNVFETTKQAGAEFTDFKLDFGAAFATQIQNLKHSNKATSNVVNGTDANKLAKIGFGFPNPTANFYVNAQLAPGIRVAMTSYLSSRHHNETWVKDGYLQIDESPIDFVPLKALMQFITVKAGDFEINYGDAHFRRSDNGNAMSNPFVGNYILDSFTTQIGGEVYLKANGIIAMGGVTAGELRGTVLTPEQRGPSYIGKVGIDRQVNKDVRLRLTGSMYKSNKAMSDTLFSGDRAGSRYYYVLENTAATDAAQKDSGGINPGFKNKITAMQMNPFVKLRGLEVFGLVERAEGRAFTEATDRTWNHYAVDTVYRFANENLYLGARYNRAEGALAGITGNVGAKRWQVGGGWFLTPNILSKVEYVNQKYFGYPVTNIKNGGNFKGLMLEGVVAF